MFFHYIRSLFKEIFFILSILINIIGFGVDNLKLFPSLQISPQTYIVVLIIGYFIANYNLYKNRYFYLDQDRKLFKNIFTILPPEGSIDFIRTFDFGAIIDMKRLDDLIEFSIQGKHPNFIFLDKKLERYRKNLFKTVLEWRDYLSANSFSLNHNNSAFYRIKDWDNHSDDSVFDELQLKLNKLADKIISLYDMFIKIAKEKDIYQ